MELKSVKSQSDTTLARLTQIENRFDNRLNQIENRFAHLEGTDKRTNACSRPLCTYTQITLKF